MVQILISLYAFIRATITTLYTYPFEIIYFISKNKKEFIEVKDVYEPKDYRFVWFIPFGIDVVLEDFFSGIKAKRHFVLNFHLDIEKKPSAPFMNMWHDLKNDAESAVNLVWHNIYWAMEESGTFSTRFYRGKLRRDTYYVHQGILYIARFFDRNPNKPFSAHKNAPCYRIIFKKKLRGLPKKINMNTYSLYYKSGDKAMRKQLTRYGEKWVDLIEHGVTYSHV